MQKRACNTFGVQTIHCKNDNDDRDDGNDTCKDDDDDDDDDDDVTEVVCVCVCMCVCVCSAHRNTLHVVEIAPLHMGQSPPRASSASLHPSHKHTCPHGTMTKDAGLSVQTTHSLPLEAPAGGAGADADAAGMPWPWRRVAICRHSWASTLTA